MLKNYVIMVNGLPGKMATLVARGIAQGSSEKIDLCDYALTGPNMPSEIRFATSIVQLIPKKSHEQFLSEYLGNLQKSERLIAVDFVKGEDQANRNAGLYFMNGIPFVMGSTGADYDIIDAAARSVKIPCVAFPNMDMRIVAWMFGISQMAEKCPGAFEGASFDLIETHQADKGEETSGTMKDMLKYLSRLSKRELTLADIKRIRDPDIQTRLFGVPDQWLGWHAYHVIKVFDAEERDGTRNREDLIFKRHGGESYRQGTMKALDFLIQVLERDGEAKRYTMFDVFQGVK